MPDEYFKITHNGKTVILRKLDIGPERPEDRRRRLEREWRKDFYPPVAESLGFSGHRTIEFPKDYLKEKDEKEENA